METRQKPTIKVKPILKPLGFIIAVHNCKRKWINQCLESINDQSVLPAVVSLVHDKPTIDKYYTNNFFEKDLLILKKKFGTELIVSEQPDPDLKGCGEAFNIGLQKIIEFREKNGYPDNVQLIGADDYILPEYINILKWVYENWDESVEEMRKSYERQLPFRNVDMPDEEYQYLEKRKNNRYSGIKSFDLQHFMDGHVEVNGEMRHLKNQVVGGKTLTTSVYNIDDLLSLSLKDVEDYIPWMEKIDKLSEARPEFFKIVDGDKIRWKPNRPRGVDGCLEAIYMFKFRQILIPHQWGRWYVYRIHDSNISHDNDGLWKGEPDE